MAEFTAGLGQVVKNILVAESLSESIGDNQALADAQTERADSLSQPKSSIFCHNNLTNDINLYEQVEHGDVYSETAIVKEGDFSVSVGNIGCATSLFKNKNLDESVSPLKGYTWRQPRLGSDSSFRVTELRVQYPMSRGSVRDNVMPHFTVDGGIDVNPQAENVAQINFSHRCNHTGVVCPGIAISAESSQIVKPSTVDVGVSLIVPIQDQNSSFGMHAAATSHYYRRYGMRLGSVIPTVALQQQLNGIVFDVTEASTPMENTLERRLGIDYITPVFGVRNTTAQGEVAVAIGQRENPLDPIAAVNNNLNILVSDSTFFSAALGLNLHPYGMTESVEVSLSGQYGIYPEVERGDSNIPVDEPRMCEEDGYRYNNFGFAFTVPLGHGGLFSSS